MFFNKLLEDSPPEKEPLQPSAITTPRLRTKSRLTVRRYGDRFLVLGKGRLEWLFAYYSLREIPKNSAIRLETGILSVAAGVSGLLEAILPRLRYNHATQ
jgi:hypothetical protein